MQRFVAALKALENLRWQKHSHGQISSAARKARNQIDRLLVTNGVLSLKNTEMDASFKIAHASNVDAAFSRWLTAHLDTHLNAMRSWANSAGLDAQSAAAFGALAGYLKSINPALQRLGRNQIRVVVKKVMPAYGKRGDALVTKRYVEY